MARKIPRGKGYDQVSIRKHWRVVLADGLPVAKYARANGLRVDTFMLALKHHLPMEIDQYLVSRPELFPTTVPCQYCGDAFYPSTKAAKFCGTKCGRDSRTDKEYFGGNRRNTIGLKEGVCGLCQRSTVKGLSSHHLYGKSNDTANEHLLALCKGCHAIVSDLALKTWCDDAEKLERLILLASTQRFGENWMRRRTQGLQLSVQVILGTRSTEPGAPPAIDQGD